MNYCQPQPFNGVAIIHLLPKTCTKCELLKKRKEKFKNQLAPFVETYGREMMNAFYAYWVEMNKSQTKMRWELEKVWSLELRLSRWDRNQKFENKPKLMPEYYDRKYESTLSQTEAMAYTQNLVKLGFKPIKSQEGTIVNWIR